MTEYKLLEGKFVEHSNELWDKLLEVNKRVNKVRYQTDIENYGVPEKWVQSAIQRGAADCDDYMMTKRMLLMEAGLPWQCLVPATCMISGEGHAVLFVRTSRDIYVLDNMRNDILPWKGLRIQGVKYEWLDYLEPTTRHWMSLASK